MAITGLDQMTRDGAAGLVVGKTNHCIDRIVRQIHDLDDRASGIFQHGAGSGILIGAGDDHAGRLLSQHLPDQALLLILVIMGVTDLYLQIAAVDTVVDPSQNVGEDVLGQRGNKDADHIGADRGQGAGIQIRNIVQLANGIVNHPPQRFGNLARITQRPRHGNGADTGATRHIGDCRTTIGPATTQIHSPKCPNADPLPSARRPIVRQAGPCSKPVYEIRHRHSKCA